MDVILAVGAGGIALDLDWVCVLLCLWLMMC